MTDIRCFVAVELPESMREEIGRIEADLKVPGLRLIKPDLCHMTLKFLGEVPEKRVQRTIVALKGVKATPFDLTVAGVGTFPSRSIKVVWLGLKGETGDLHKQVEDALESLGFEMETRKFSPHVTIGRVGRPNLETTQELTPKIARFSDVDLGTFRVDRFNLKKSTLTREGPIYENLAEYGL
jgi:2'-5' RNA ligase